MLTAVKLPELIARSVTDYIGTAVELVQEPERLAALRHALRGLVAGSPLCDGRGKARQVERLYRALWRRWCRRQVA